MHSHINLSLFLCFKTVQASTGNVVQHIHDYLHNLYSSPRYHYADKIRDNEVGGACGKHGRGEKIVYGKPEGKRPLGRPRRRWKDGIRMDLREISRGRLDPVGSGWGPVAGSCEYGDEHSVSGDKELVIFMITLLNYIYHSKMCGFCVYNPH
jgi:hypothetical protein